MNNSDLKEAPRAERHCCPPPPSPLESHECAFLLSRKGINLNKPGSGKPSRLTWATSAEMLTRESSAAPRQHPEVGFVSPRQAPSKHFCSLVLVHWLETKTENKWIKIPPPQNIEKRDAL